MNGFASLLGWLAAAAVLIVFVHRRHLRKNSDVPRGAARSSRHLTLSQDVAYLQKQAANLQHLKKEALSSGHEADLFVEQLELRQFLDDAAAFIVEARAGGSPILLKKAAEIQRRLLSLGVGAEDLDRAIRHNIYKAKRAPA